MARRTKPARVSAKNPAAINSSFTIFFIGATIVWSYLLCFYFPDELQGMAMLLMIAFTLMLYVFRFLLLQFHSAVTVLRLVVLYVGMIAALSFMSAVRGPISDQYVAGVQLLFLSNIIMYAGPVLLTAAVFPFYGAAVTACAAATATVLELAYNLILKVVPKSLRTSLQLFDSRVDQASDTASWKMFALREWQGIAAVCVIFALYTAIYSLLLITR